MVQLFPQGLIECLANWILGVDLPDAGYTMFVVALIQLMRETGAPGQGGKLSGDDVREHVYDYILEYFNTAQIILHYTGELSTVV